MEGKMKRKLFYTIGLLAACVGLSSCSALKSQYYVGEQEAISENDLGNETVWMQGEVVYFVKRVDSNTVVAATMEWDKKKNDYAVRSFPLVLSKLGDHIFLNAKDGELYTILRVAVADDESLLLFTVNPDKMKRDITDGKVKAHEEGGNIIMDCSKEEQDEYILKNIDTMFYMDSARDRKSVV